MPKGEEERSEFCQAAHTAFPLGLLIRVADQNKEYNIVLRLVVLRINKQLLMPSQLSGRKKPSFSGPEVRLSIGDNSELHIGPQFFKGHPSSLCPSCTLRSRRGSALRASEADIALSSLQAPDADQQYLPHLDFGQTRAQPPCGFQLLQERSMKAAATVSGANSWNTVCLHAAGSHPPAAAQEAKAQAPRRGKGSRIHIIRRMGINVFYHIGQIGPYYTITI